MDNFVVERGEFFLWIRLLTSSSSSRHSHNLAMIEKRIEDRSDVTHSTSNAFVHVHVQNTFSYVCLFMKKSFTQQTWLHHSFSVCRSTLLFSVCRTILHLSVCRTILHLSIFVELSTFVGLFLLQYFSLSLCRSILLLSVCREVFFSSALLINIATSQQEWDRSLKSHFSHRYSFVECIFSSSLLLQVSFWSWLIIFQAKLTFQKMLVI